MTKANYPGKVILFGEHSIVYPGHNAVIIPIDLQARAEAEIIQGEQKIIFQEPNSSWFKEPFECTFESAISTYTMLKDLHSKSEYEEIDRALHEDFGFLRALFGLILIEVRKSSENTIPSFGIILKVNIPYGSGFGSSAAYSAAIIHACMKLFGHSYSQKEIYDLVFKYESFIHKNPSGADPAAVVYNQPILFGHGESGNKTISKLSITNEQLSLVLRDAYIVQTGKPVQSTGEMVRYVRNKYEEDPEKYNEFFKQIDTIIDSFMKKNITQESMYDLVNRNGKLLEDIGVVSDSAIKFSEYIRKDAGAVKVVGAGGYGATTGSGAMIVFHKDSSYIKNCIKDFGFSLVDVFKK